MRAHEFRAEPVSHWAEGQDYCGHVEGDQMCILARDQHPTSGTREARIDTDELRRLLGESEARPGTWTMDSESDLTMDGRFTPKLIAEKADGYFLTFARGNRDHITEARLTVAAVNSLPALLDEIERLRGLLDRSRAEADRCVGKGGGFAHDDRLCDEINKALADYDRARAALEPRS